MGRLFQLVAGLTAAVGLASCGNYRGPTLQLSVGYQGVNVGLTLFSAPPTAAEKVAQNLTVLTSGKNPVLHE